jgi:DNA-binding Lrp family transcriptional regulator
MQHRSNVGELRPPELVEGLPASARTVYAKLQETGPLTHRDLVERTGMPPRTVRYAVGRLRQAGVIDARCNLMDCRQCFFYCRNNENARYQFGNVRFAGIREVS